MEGLIKGLGDVVLGHHRRDDREEDDQSREERSRSTWAEVASGRQDGDDRGDRHRPYQPRREEEDEMRREDSEFQNSRPSSRPPHQAVNQGCQKQEFGDQQHYDPNIWKRKEESKKEEDGWETVDKKPQRKSHQFQKDSWQGYKRPASEQEYSNEVEVGSKLVPSREELSDLSQACNKLWELDVNRLVPGKDYEIDVGEGKKVYNKQDMAEGSLFRWLSEDIFRRPTFSRFCSLLDNYNPDVGHRETVTSEERQEQTAFIEEISRTGPIKYLHKYLSSKGVVSENYQDFKSVLSRLWFDLHNRGGTSGSSSAFEHVFVGEVKQRGEEEVTGFHNWIQFYLEEAKGRVDYQGFILPRRRGEFPDSESQLLSIQFEWNGVLKSVSSTFIGVSPEFEMALYTLCFFTGGEDNYVELGPYSVNIKCYRCGDNIGSVFPIAE